MARVHVSSQKHRVYFRLVHVCRSVLETYEKLAVSQKKEGTSCYGSICYSYLNFVSLLLFISNLLR
jgi:cob(I)alamin adenosyltransferase